MYFVFSALFMTLFDYDSDEFCKALNVVNDFVILYVSLLATSKIEHKVAHRSSGNFSVEGYKP